MVLVARHGLANATVSVTPCVALHVGERAREKAALDGVGACCAHVREEAALALGGVINKVNNVAEQ
eukprot:4009903-Alexandrium_andersonii.AAC.1